MMERRDVWDTMAEAYLSARGDLRGGQSAALLVVEARSHRNPLLDRVFDLRVEHHEHPLDELRRLMRLGRAYFHSAKADALLAREEYDRALAERSARSSRTISSGTG
jgi:uncharacterized Ntn-hydrolase superfamily protein